MKNPILVICGILSLAGLAWGIYSMSGKGSAPLRNGMNGDFSARSPSPGTPPVSSHLPDKRPMKGSAESDKRPTTHSHASRSRSPQFIGTTDGTSNNPQTPIAPLRSTASLPTVSSTPSPVIAGGGQVGSPSKSQGNADQTIPSGSIEVEAAVPITEQLSDAAIASLPESTRNAVLDARDSFRESMSDYAKNGTDSEEYYQAYDQNARDINEFLRGHLGWEQFNSLSGQALVQAQTTYAAPPATNP